MEFRRLTPDDRPALEAFECARFRQPWTEEVQYGVREGLTDAMTLGAVVGLGLWDGGRLCGIAVWSVRRDDPGTWECHAIAVALGYAGRGLGHKLKAAVMDAAREAGASTVISLVHRDNVAMIKVNQRAGASIAPDPDDPLRLYLLCTIVL